MCVWYYSPYESLLRIQNAALLFNTFTEATHFKVENVEVHLTLFYKLQLGRSFRNK